MKTQHNGRYITLNDLENGNLRLTLTDEGKAEMLENYVESVKGDENSIFPDEIVFNQDHRSILWDLLEDIICNSEMELLSENDYGKIGALTSAPIIAFNVQRDDNGELENVGRVFWFESYQIASELEELLTVGFVDFDKAE